MKPFLCHTTAFGVVCSVPEETRTSQQMFWTEMLELLAPFRFLRILRRDFHLSEHLGVFACINSMLTLVKYIAYLCTREDQDSSGKKNKRQEKLKWETKRVKRKIEGKKGGKRCRRASGRVRRNRVEDESRR